MSDEITAEDFGLIEVTAGMSTGREHKYMIRLDLSGYGINGEVQVVSDVPGDLLQKVYNFDDKFGTDFFKKFNALKHRDEE